MLFQKHCLFRLINLGTFNTVVPIATSSRVIELIVVLLIQKITKSHSSLTVLSVCQISTEKIINYTALSLLDSLYNRNYISPQHLFYFCEQFTCFTSHSILTKIINLYYYG